MQDCDIIRKHLDAFFEGQHRGIESRAPHGGSVSDIRAALSEIRNVLPECSDDTSLPDWLTQAQGILAIEKQRFRQENVDEAGWGAATFTELSDSLYLLNKER